MQIFSCNEHSHSVRCLAIHILFFYFEFLKHQGVFKGCYKGVTRVLLGSYKGVIWVLQECYMGVTRELQGCY